MVHFCSLLEQIWVRNKGPLSFKMWFETALLYQSASLQQDDSIIYGKY